MTIDAPLRVGSGSLKAVRPLDGVVLMVEIASSDHHLPHPLDSVLFLPCSRRDLAFGSRMFARSSIASESTASSVGVSPPMALANPLWLQDFTRYGPWCCLLSQGYGTAMVRAAVLARRVPPRNAMPRLPFTIANPMWK